MSCRANSAANLKKASNYLLLLISNFSKIGKRKFFFQKLSKNFFSYFSLAPLILGFPFCVNSNNPRIVRVFTLDRSPTLTSPFDPPPDPFVLDLGSLRSLVERLELIRVTMGKKGMRKSKFPKGVDPETRSIPVSLEGHWKWSCWWLMILELNECLCFPLTSRFPCARREKVGHAFKGIKGEKSQN